MSPLQPSAPIAIPSNTDSRDDQQKEDSIGSNHFSTPEEFSNFCLINGQKNFIATVSNAKVTFPVFLLLFLNN